MPNMKSKKISHKAITDFLNECRKHRNVKPDNIKEYVEKAKLGDKESALIVQCSVAFYMVKVVYRYSGILGIDAEDLFMASVIGVQRAIMNYDPSRNSKFLTYAYYWILSEIGKCIKESFLIQLPSDLKSYYYVVKEFVAVFYSQYERTPTIDEIHEYIGVPKDVIKEVIQSINSYYLSLDNHSDPYGFEDYNIEDFIYYNLYANANGSEHVSEPEKNAINAFMEGKIKEVMSLCLSPEEYYIVQARYGLLDGKERSIREIAEELASGVNVGGVFIKKSLNHGRISQILETALVKLRKAMNKKEC